MMRTATCGQLNKNDVNKEVVLCGWVHRRRDHGKLIFIDIRDRYGLTQVVFNPKEYPEVKTLSEQLRPEFVILLKGKVGLRPKGMENPKIPTGAVEVVAAYLEILNSAQTPAFEIDDTLDVSEELRLTYRYLDLRRPSVMNALLLRHRLCQYMRSYFDKAGFVDVETPILTKSTPEGARDFLVPSRLSPGQFFALPQSPQLFKQILMVSGLDRYFQIAKCFRDEDLRSDRQLEFTQLDLEMSFINEEDIYGLLENLFKEIFKNVLEKNLKTPFPRITYQESQAKYKSDKPDLRQEKEEFAFVWITDFPLFKYNNEEKRWDSEHHPFTAPNPQDSGLLEGKDLEKVRARAYDLVLNGVELGSGSIRIHQREVQQKIFEILGIDKQSIDERFGFLLKAFEYGAPPHGGFAFGIDRLVAMLIGTDTIRDTIAFPKTQKGICPLTNAPSNVEDKQLKELGISILKKVN